MYLHCFEGRVGHHSLEACIPLLTAFGWQMSYESLRSDRLKRFPVVLNNTLAAKSLGKHVSWSPSAAARRGRRETQMNPLLGWTMDSVNPTQVKELVTETQRELQISIIVWGERWVRRYRVH